jgi:hypothetical protein
MRYRAVCRYCGESSGLPRKLNLVVLIAIVAFFATTPYLLSKAGQDTLAIVLVFAFIAILLALPLSKRA